MKGSYKAVEVAAPGSLRVVERAVVEPGAGQVRIRVEACGVCHSDVATVTVNFPGLRLPRVPGHEVVGRVGRRSLPVEGRPARRYRLFRGRGRRVRVVPARRRGAVHEPVYSGVTSDGGYAELMIAEARGLATIPDTMAPAEAAPILCAGVTTYNGLRNAGLRGGDLVAVQGIGGLGHLAVQFARRMGFDTVAIGRGREKERLALELGAHVYVDTSKEDAAAALQRLGGARAILAKAPSGAAMGPWSPASPRAASWSCSPFRQTRSG